MLDDAGIRPPIIAAGINLFGGPLGLIHKHVTGALPIRRNTKDPAYLITLKAYVSELLHKHDLFFYPEGGRSYSGELKPMKTGLLNAALDAQRAGTEADAGRGRLRPGARGSRDLASSGSSGSQKAFSREIAELVRYAVGYRSRAFVTFGKPIAIDGIDGENKKAVMDLTRHVRAEIGQLYKVLPTAVLATAMTRSMTRADLKIAHRRHPRYVALGRRQPQRHVGRRSAGARDRAAGNAQHHRGRAGTLPRPRAQRAPLLRALNRAPAHAAGSTCSLMLDATSKALFHGLAQVPTLQRLASKYGMAPRRLRPPLHRRRDR